jgi:uncharacterized membrane protein SpoIIM required for sporulation
MTFDLFCRERERDWARLEELLGAAGGRAERLGVEGALELGALYRATAADLALARRRYPGDPLVPRLERLVVAGRAAVYDLRVRRASPVRFFGERYWCLVRERRGVLAAAIAALAVPAAAGALWALHDPGAAIGLVPARFRGAADPHVHRLAAGVATQATLAGSIFTNNLQVTFLVFAGGLTLGAVTLLVLAYNGLMVGTLAGVTIGAGNFGVFLRYVVPHGVLELSCIAVCGMAGLRLGWALAVPGPVTRGAALREAARPAVAIVLGTAPWIVLAGLVEGFLTPHGVSLGAALGVGCGLGAVYWTLVLLGGPLRAARAVSR